MRDFRPISLCTIVYNCITKIIARRLQVVVPTLIDIAQSAFTKGRNISDNILMAQELFRGYSRENGVAKYAIKIDLHKAFDSLSWEFIISVLHRMNFPVRFVGWIKDCITSLRYSIKINGVLEGFFPGAKGLRQGDPMSPYLFALAINVLSCLLANKPEDFKLHPKCKELALTHLLYADDVLLIFRGNSRIYYSPYDLPKFLCFF